MDEHQQARHIGNGDGNSASAGHDNVGGGNCNDDSESESSDVDDDAGVTADISQLLDEALDEDAAQHNIVDTTDTKPSTTADPVRCRFYRNINITMFAYFT